MKKLYSIIMTAVLLSQTLLVASAEDESLEPDVDSHGTGLAEMTQEEWDSFNAKLPRIVDIKPNEIAV